MIVFKKYLLNFELINIGKILPSILYSLRKAKSPQLG